MAGQYLPGAHVRGGGASSQSRSTPITAPRSRRGSTHNPPSNLMCYFCGDKGCTLVTGPEHIGPEHIKGISSAYTILACR